MKDFRSGLPSANPTISFWQTPPNAEFENYKSYEKSEEAAFHTTVANV
jgi:hypothetical protein